MLRVELHAVLRALIKMLICAWSIGSAAVGTDNPRVIAMNVPLLTTIKLAHPQ